MGRSCLRACTVAASAGMALTLGVATAAADHLDAEIHEVGEIDFDPAGALRLITLPTPDPPSTVSGESDPLSVAQPKAMGLHGLSELGLVLTVSEDPLDPAVLVPQLVGDAGPVSVTIGTVLAGSLGEFIAFDNRLRGLPEGRGYLLSIFDGEI